MWLTAAVFLFFPATLGSATIKNNNSEGTVFDYTDYTVRKPNVPYYDPKPIDKIECSCVLYAQYLKPDSPIYGYGKAKNIPINSLTPADEGFVLTYESDSGHISWYVRSNDRLILQESNYTHCKILVGRTLPIGSPLIRGYINYKEAL